ncbi:class II aldolase/adducin family protein [Streptomyces sp. LUP30]|uniref:class II aldolase/adducin family protein n=1 Tax=Streptomyces sp. LUP30 TaxID=1890285 RepID=UPI000851A421|nr:class II aldolase/adducin family protein [Streptomyces sp. LUP30]
MTASSSTLSQERAAVADACRRLGAEGLLIGTAGNVSVRAGDLVAVTATGAVLARLTPDQVTVVDLDGTVVAGDLQPTSELELHLGVYRRYGVGAVVHTHAPMATAVSCVLDELPCIHYQLLALGGTVRVAPYATFGTPELAASVLTALDGRSAALMANHGAVTHGATLDDAVENALLLEWGCGVYRNAAAMGRPRVLDEQQQVAVIEAAVARRYGATHPVPPAPAPPAPPAQEQEPTKGESR